VPQISLLVSQKAEASSKQKPILKTNLKNSLSFTILPTLNREQSDFLLFFFVFCTQQTCK